MAVFAPALAAIGGGSAIAGGVTVASALVGAYGAVQQHQAGQLAKAEAKANASREADAAREEEITRRRALMDTIADRAAVAGAQGVGTGGSIGALARRDIRDNKNDLLISNVNSKAKQRAMRAWGNNQARSGTIAAGASLLDSAAGLYNNMPRKAG